MADLPHNRPDLNTFEPGAIYQEDQSDSYVEFIGIGTLMSDGEDVAVFRFVDVDETTPDKVNFVPGDGCLIATKDDYDNGQTFELMLSRPTPG